MKKCEWVFFSEHSVYTAVQESLANAKVSARQQCVRRPLVKKTTANQRWEHNVEDNIHSVGYITVADNTGRSSFV